MVTWSPGPSSRSAPSSKRSLALPAITATHSCSAWSYQNPSGLRCPRDTIRSTRTSSPRATMVTCSSGRDAGISWYRLPLLVITLIHPVQVGSNVAGFLLADADPRHGGERIDGGRVHNPSYQVVRLVGEYPRDVHPLRKAGQGRPDPRVGARDSGHRVAGATAVVANEDAA